jgi:hypothetical protein
MEEVEEEEELQSDEKTLSWLLEWWRGVESLLLLEPPAAAE